MRTFTRVVSIFLLNAILIFFFFIAFLLILVILSGGDPREGGFLIGISPIFFLGVVGIVVAILGGILNATAVNIMWRSLAGSDGLPIKCVSVLSALLAGAAAIMAGMGSDEHSSPYVLPVSVALLFLVFASSNLLTIQIAKTLFPLNEPSKAS